MIMVLQIIDPEKLNNKKRSRSMPEYPGEIE